MTLSKRALSLTLYSILSLVLSVAFTSSASATNPCLDVSVAFVQDTADTVCKVTVKNAFSPNSDDVNDWFSPEFNCPLRSYHFTIYNRWGNVVFESKDPKEVWTGTTGKGKKKTDLPSGVYLWMLQYQFEGSTADKPEEQQGNVTMIR